MKNGSRKTVSLLVAGTLMILVAFGIGAGFQKSAVSALGVQEDFLIADPQLCPLPEPDFLLAAVAEATPDDEDETNLDGCEAKGKVLICHVPPGNPENPQTLCVSQSGAERHFREHDGDYAGTCQPPTPTPTVTQTPEPTATSIPEPTATPTPTPTGNAVSPATLTPTAMPSVTPSSAPTPKPGVTSMPLELKVEVKAPDGQDAELGETLYYTFTVRNIGETTDSYILTLASEYEFPARMISVTRNPGNRENPDIVPLRNITPIIIELAPGQHYTISVSVELPLSGNIQSHRLALTATSRTDDDVKDTDMVITQIAAPQPDILFTKDADKTQLIPGEQVVYTLTYRNTGNAPLLNAVIEDRLPQELRFIDSSLTVELVDQQTLRFALPPVLPQNQGDQLTITAQVDPDSDIRGQFVNTAVFSAENLPDPVSASSRASIEVPELRIEKTVNKSEASVGDILLYTITVTNSGSSVARNANVIDTFPAVMQYVRGSSVINGQVVGDPESHGAQAVLWMLGTLQAGDQVILRYQTTILADAKSGVYRNKASVEAQDSSGQQLLAGPVKTNVRVALGGARLSAEIEGSVFLDSNGNRFRDAGEPGLPNIEIRFIRGRIVANTDEEGEFFFGEVPPGDQAIALDETTLQPGYHLTTDSTVLLSLAEGDVGYVEFGVQSDFGNIVGTVYHDVNANGQRDPGEPGVAGIRLDIDNTVFFITDQSGQVTATHFPVGTHTVALNEPSLPGKFQSPF